ncbi:SusC/RagA family TonB-linked outer membrane protein [Rufibacter latericius]|uniref:TonB-dependent receptor n=1 Tax=Rufibacter latericius TaxID=2487040 RepID=A0A3M9MLW6_9BACT|nr:TonB-dependent receptor [Rufibacter latericius]RNI26195.1 TonB-dependent receptor [Rufibacter latericius]
MMKSLLFSFVLMLTLAGQVWAQERTVTGRVTDAATGETMPGVTVQLKGTSTATPTDVNGAYSIAVPATGGSLIFTFIGYANQEVAIGSQSSINVRLTTDARTISEVVVTGYGVQQSRQEFTGAASTVTGSEIQDRPVQSFGQALTGKASGVNIIQPNGLLNNPPIIRVRGVNSISLSSFPLIVLDGIPISSDEIGDNSAANNVLSTINPSDIESIDILKDAASTSIYGSRAANGVLVITTKKGKKGSVRVNYDGWVGINQATRLPDLLNAQQYIDHKNGALRNTATPSAPGFFPSTNPDGSMVDTDWLDLIYRKAVSHNHALSVSGGTDKTTYYFSTGYSDQEGFIKKNEFQRKSARLNLTQKVTDWLSLTGNINYTNGFNQAPNSGSLPGSGFSVAGLGRIGFVLAPNVSPYNADGSYNLSGNALGNGANISPYVQTYYNPMVLLDKDLQTSETNRMVANIGGNFSLFKGLTFKTTYSYDLSSTESKLFYNPINGDGFNQGGLATNSNYRRENWNWINTLQYQTSIADKHNISILVGSDAQQQDDNYWWATRQGLSVATLNDFQASYGTNTAGGGIGKRVYEAYLSSVSYNYANKYFFSANYRRDGNSALANRVRWGDFGGASVGWAVAEEDFFKNSTIANTISNLKLKGSWGRVGNGNLNSDYAPYTLYSPGLYATAPSLQFTQAGNEELAWETSNQTNIGVEVGVLNNRVSLEVNYYKNDINGLILGVPQAPSKGIPGNSILQNVGSMYNKGWEFTINATPIESGKFKWSTNFNFTLNKNEVTSLVDETTPLLGLTSDTETTNITRIGQPVGSLYAVKTGGVNAENGRRIFINKDGREVQYSHGAAIPWTYLDGTRAPAVSGADAQLAGNTLPKWYGGFTNNLSYGGFDLSLLLTYSGGNYIYNGTQAGLRDQRIWNNSTDVLRAWTPENPNTDIPRAVYGDNVSNGSSFPIDANIQKGDFLRLQNAVLGYRLPTALFGKSGISSLRVYAQVDNAFLITDYKGSDPEISTNGSSNIAPGVERNSVPQGRMFTFGVNLGF